MIMSELGITLDAASINEASVATFARSGASYIRFIAKGMSPRTYMSLAKAFMECGLSVRQDFDILFDLPGRRPRLGSLFEEQVIFRGMTVLLVDEETRDNSIVSNLVIPVVNMNIYLAEVKVGDRLLISDGATELHVLEKLPVGILAEAVRPEARMTPNRSILMPDTDIVYRSLSDADISFAEALAASPHFPRPKIAVSMVESAEPLDRLREIVPGARVIAKIETRSGLVNRLEIARAADALMIARGDLSLSLGLGVLPAATELIVEAGREAGKDVVLATGLFDGVTLQGRPIISDTTDLWHYWRLGITSFLLSGGNAGEYGRKSLESADSALSDFRFAIEDLTL